MVLDTPTELINSVKGRFTGKLATIKDFILNKGGELDRLSDSEGHWTKKTDPSKQSSDANGWNDWEDYIKGIDNFIPVSSTWKKDDQWKKIKTDILSVLARLIIHGVKSEQSKEANQAEKAKWWNDLNTYITNNNSVIEKNTYNDTSANDGKDNKQIIADIKTAGTITASPVITQDTQAGLIKSIEDTYFTGILAKIKTSALTELNKGHDGSGYGKGVWTGDWKTYINGAGGNPATSLLEKAEFEKRKKTILYQLAKIVIKLTKQSQATETDQAEKKKWWDAIDNYMKIHTHEAENYLYNGVSDPTYKDMIADIRKVGANLPPHGLTGFPTAHFTNFMAGGVYGRGQRAYDKIKQEKKAVDSDKDKYRKKSE